MNIFDSIQKTAFAIVTTTFGNAAIWVPSNSETGEEKKANVLYKDATEATGISDNDYNIERYVMEYQAGDFDGLKESVAKGGDEKVRIETEGGTGVYLEFFVRRTERKYDGKTIVAILNPVN